MEQRQNLVFIMTDHQRADSIGMVQTDKNGQPTEVCPTLNRLAAEGAYFSRMYNASPLCVPARTALATGKYPTHNGIVYNDWRGTRGGQHLTLHQVLAESGYDVVHIGVDHIRVSPTLREQIDFVKWIDKTDHQRYLKDLGL
jgi:choline-sulfatase